MTFMRGFSGHFLGPKLMLFKLIDTHNNFEMFCDKSFGVFKSRPLLTKVRVGTEMFQGNQIHSSNVWTLRIPKM